MVIRRVSGLSMTPTLDDGDIVIAKRINNGDIITGDIAIVSHQGRDLIKRVVNINGQDMVIKGDNLGASTDSRHFGSIPVANAKWRVVIVWPKLALLPRAVTRS